VDVHIARYCPRHLSPFPYPWRVRPRAESRSAALCLHFRRFSASAYANGLDTGHYPSDVATAPRHPVPGSECGWRTSRPALPEQSDDLSRISINLSVLPRTKGCCRAIRKRVDGVHFLRGYLSWIVTNRHVQTAASEHQERFHGRTNRSDVGLSFSS
jgi:hypothetical protein